MIKLLHLNKLLKITIFFTALIFKSDAVVAAIDIWEKKENKNEQNNQIDDEKEITIKSPILSSNENTDSENISELELDQHEQTIIGLFDPKDNNFDILLPHS